MSPIGVSITTTEAPQTSGVPVSTGTAFFAGLADQGATTTVKCLSLADYVATFGARSATSSVLYDAVDAYFREAGPGAVCQVARVTDSSAVSATLTLQDAVPHPTVVVTYKTPGVAGNNYYVRNVVSGGNFTITIEDVNANVLETHGPYTATSQLYADTTSTLVNFTQSAGSGFTTSNPVAVGPTALATGANANDLTDANYVSTANSAFPPSLGPGQVACPGRTSTTVYTGLGAHAAANNRIACIDVTDSATVSTVTSGVSTLPTNTNADRLLGATWLTIPGVTPGTTRTVAGSAVLAGLCARVAATGNDNQAPAGRDWQLQYATAPTQTYTDAQITTLNAAGVNAFMVRFNTLCLFGFSSMVPATTDQIFWQASAGRERMSLVAACQRAAEPFLFKTIDGRGHLIKKWQGVLQGIVADHWSNDALFGNTAVEAGTVDVDSPVNTTATAQAGQLNARMNVRISPFDQNIGVVLVSVPITQAL